MSRRAGTTGPAGSVGPVESAGPAGPCSPSAWAGLPRAGLEELRPHDAVHLPTATLTVNLVGALLLGALTGFLAAMGPDRGGLGLVRLAAGTGLMGGLTTHSTYILEVARMLQHDREVPALAYLLGSLAAGLAAAAVGLVLGDRIGRRRSHRQENPS